ncbi:MAG: TonB-dependent receptor plug domain-containing protein [Opitutales bacterium]|nr:TonB-dependent receptor plug domain-containing protein [Opitutales bacterium]
MTLTLVTVSIPAFAQVTKDPQAVAAAPETALKNPVAATPTDASDEVVQISPFVVKTGSDNRIEESNSGTLVSRPLEKTPMGITVVSSEMMKDLMILNADGLSKIVPGIANQNNTSSEGTGNNTQYSSRGFTVIPRRNGFAPGGRLYDMTGIDRVEIIRGPNSILFGQNDPGGVINYVTKRPTIRDGVGAHGVFTLALGDFDFYRTQTDIDATIIPGQLAIRLPMSYTTNKREFKWYKNRVEAVNPSVVWRIFPRTELTFEWEHLDVYTNFAAFQPVAWTPPGGTEFADIQKRGLGYSNSEGSASNYTFGPYSHANNKQTNWTLDLTSRITDHITFRGIYSNNKRNRDEVVPQGGDPFRVTPLPYRGQETQDGNRIRGYKGDLLAEYDLGPFKTRTVVGFEYNENDFFAKVWRTYQNGANLNLFTLNVGFDPVTGKATRDTVASDYLPFPSNNYKDNSADPTNPWRIESGPSLARQKWTNQRISEVLSAYDDRLQLLLGYARGKSTTFTFANTTFVQTSEISQSANVYQIGAGVMVDREKKHMLFVNRSTSYAPQFLLDINNNFLPSQTAVGTEGGFKSKWSESFSSTVTLFTQRRTNVGRQYNDPVLLRTYGILTPGEMSRGVELETVYRPTKQLDVQFALAQFHGEITGAPPGREFVIGRELPRSPEKSWSLFTNYRFEGGALDGFRLGMGANHKNDTWLDTGLNQTTLGRRSTPYTVVWLTAAKEFKLENKRSLVVRLNVGNLTNKEYISEGFTFGDPRSIRLSTDFKF